MVYNAKYSLRVTFTEIGEDAYSIIGGITEHWTGIKQCLRSVKSWLETPDYFEYLSIEDNETDVVMAQFSPLGSLIYTDKDFYKIFFFEYLSQLME